MSALHVASRWVFSEPLEAHKRDLTQKPAVWFCPAGSFWAFLKKITVILEHFWVSGHPAVFTSDILGTESKLVLIPERREEKTRKMVFERSLRSRNGILVWIPAEYGPGNFSFLPLVVEGGGTLSGVRVSVHHGAEMHALAAWALAPG